MAPAADFNAQIGGLLRDMAAIQTDRQKTFGYKRAAAVVLALDRQLPSLVERGHPPPRIPGLGPASWRIITEVLETGSSATVDAALVQTSRAGEILRHRELRHHVLSRAEVRRVLADPALKSVSIEDYRGDLQMHSEWSDGTMPLRELVDACVERGYTYAAVTDHSHGLPIARGMSADAMRRQQAAIAEINREATGPFRLLAGIEANIGADGTLDLSGEDIALCDVVLAAPHSRLRTSDDQTGRLLRAIETPGVHILAHPRGRMSGSRAGLVADWDAVFARAAKLGVAVEIDGDPSRQDLDHSLARQALDAGCLFALDSDAHSTRELVYAETAVAHARLAGIPASRIVNCWPLDRVLEWTESRRSGRSRRSRPRAGRVNR